MVLDTLPHVFEECEGLTLVFDQRVSLPIRPETDTLTQMVEGQQMVLPLAIDSIEKEELLQPGEVLGTKLLRPLLVVGLCAIVQSFLELRPVDHLPIDPELVDGEAKITPILFLQGFGLPSLPDQLPPDSTDRPSSRQSRRPPA